MRKFLFILIITGCAMAEQGNFPFVEISEVNDSFIKEIHYYETHNFVGERIDGYNAKKCFLTPSAANALSRVQDKLLKDNLSLKIFDCYRPQRAVDHFAKWAKSPERDLTKERFFPNVPSDELFSQGYIAEKSGHSRGSTLDLTIVRLPFKAPDSFEHPCIDPDGHKYRGSELNMGTAFDCFDELSHTFNPNHPAEVIKNRKLLVDLMASEGFVNYKKEWWHFTYKPEEYPDTYFDLPIN